MNKKTHIYELIYSIIISLLFLLFCSRSSPLFPMNDWTDVNVYFTGGNLINEGKVIYRDFFDHKGPLLYFLFALITLISNSTFIGLWLVEVLCIAGFLFYTIQIAKMFVKENKIIYFSLPIIAALILSSYTFHKGGNVEELMLFPLTYSLYYFLKMIILKKDMKVIEHIIIGFIIGVIFWMKFTLLGFYIGAYIYFIITAIKNNKNILKCLAYNFLGFFIITLPIISYFVVNNALYDFIYTYFYCNLFAYSGKSTMLTKLMNLIKLAYSAKLFVIPIGLGILLLLAKRKNVMFIITTLITVSLAYSTKYMFYYSLVFAIYSFIIIILLEEIFIVTKGIFLLEGKKFYVSCIFPIVLCLILSALCCKDLPFSKYEREDLPQFKFASIINSADNSTLLNLGFLDSGFYMASEKNPVNKYYFMPNLGLPEYEEETDNIIKNRLVDFIIITDYKYNEKLHPAYECVAKESYDTGGRTIEYYLYQKLS